VPVVRDGVVVRRLDLMWCRKFDGRPIPGLPSPAPFSRRR
jgi:hypothetical protein